MGSALEEHINYLSDPIRTERFREALARTVTPGDTVADVGCGFGILGLLSLQAGASHVWGIDCTEAIDVARETMARSGLAARYTCVEESSQRAKLPQPVDIVVCDHVGYFGFDYQIVATLGDARRRLLKPGGKVVPERIILQVAAAQSSDCRKAADAWDLDPIPAEYRWLREYGANSKHTYKFAAEELASRPAELGQIDLRMDSPEHLSFSTQLVVERDGELDGLAGWFACELAEGVWMTNSPLAPDRIARSQVFLPFDTPLPVVAGDSLAIEISARHEDAVISWAARVERTGRRVRQSTWASTILSPQDRVPQADRIPRLSPAGEARRTLLDLVDGKATNAQIESALMTRFPDLFPTRDEMARFVRAELYRSTR